MRALRAILVASLATLLVGCTVVSAPGPIGDRTLALTAADWDGRWLCNDATVTIQVVSPAEGVLEVGWVESGDKGLRSETLRAQLREAGGWQLGSIADEHRPGRYVWGRVRLERNQLLVWTPDVDRFAALVHAGTLPGTVDEDGNVLLGPLSPEQTTLLTSSSAGVLLDWENPIVCLRVGQ